MKKLIALVLTLALIATMSVSAMAATVTDSGSSANADVKGVFNASGAASALYSVDVSWGSMTFTYNEGAKTWNPGNHQDDIAAGTWTASGNDITITNHTNAAVTATFAYAASGSATTGVTGGFYDAATAGTAITGSALNLATAKGTTYANAPSGMAYLQLSGGSLASGTADNTVIGTVTVTIN